MTAPTAAATTAPGFTAALYTDLIVDGTAPEPPRPSIGQRTDGEALLYANAVNVFFGPPESGKSLAASCIAADVLFTGGSVLWVDIDHNGAPATAARLRALGIPLDVLSNRDRIRYANPDDSAGILGLVNDARTWNPTLVVADSIGELASMFGASTNSSDEYVAVNRRTLAAFAMTGAAVLAIDHEAKNSDSRSYGSIGSIAKKSTVDGAMLRFTTIDQFVPGRGGKASLSITKDRHGSLRQTAPAGDREPCATVFQLIPRGEALDWKFWAPTGATTAAPTAATLADADQLDTLQPAPRSVRDVKDRMGWGGTRASASYAHWKRSRAPA